MSEPGENYEVDGDMIVFRCPIVRTGTAVLNRALFNKSVPIAAAALRDNRLINKYRKPFEAGKEILHADKLSPIASHPDKELAKQGRKCLLLNPSVKPEGSISRHFLEILGRKTRVLTFSFPQLPTLGVRCSKMVSKRRT
jgi:tRNA (guanine37-N1)-methyltransferase